ncbi:exosome nuclease subunit [Dipsacomyces acuminosporus]|nr:exosome nuclease subunit [Dipsacomyces acuminosporus]
MGKKRQHREEDEDEEQQQQQEQQQEQEQKEAVLKKATKGKHTKTDDASDDSSYSSDNNSGSDGSSDEAGDEKDLVNVDFEFFDPKPIDFHAMKRMLISSFGDDAEEFNISELVDLILEQNTVGSTVKFEGDDDPYAFLTVLNMTTHREKQAMKQITSYLLKKAEKAKVGGKLMDILNGDKDVGLLFNERVVNMPPQVVAPMLKMLMEELEWAVEDKEPYSFEYYLLMAPMYKDVAAVDDDSDDEAGGSSSRNARKKAGGSSASLDGYLHAEDEFIEEFAHLKFDYKFSRSKRVAESRNSFADTGLAPLRRCLVIHKSKVRPLIDRLDQLFEITEPQQPGDWDSTPFEFVDTPEKLQEMMDHLESSAHEIAVDLEHHNYRSYQGFTCLVQVSSRTRDFVIDSLALRSELHCLNEVTADPTRIKVFHGAESDIEWLQRDFGVYVVGLFDTYHATKVLNMPHHSLAYLLKTYVDFDADKKYQLADWRIRPIPAEMMKYARADTHFLLYVFDRLRNELLGRGERLVGEDISNPNAEHFGELSGLDVVTSATQPMELTLSKSANTAMNKYEKDGYDVENGLGGGGWATLLKKWHHPFSPTQLAVYRALHKWRDSCAREEDESTRYVLPNHMLFAISDRMPEDAPALFAACQPTPPLVRLYASDIITLIRGERTAAESRLSDMKEFIQQAQNEQALASKPVHTRFEDQDGDLNSDGGIADDMDVDDKIPSVSDDVLTKDLLESVADMIVPVSGLFGDSVSVSMVSGASDTAATDDAEASSPEARKAKNKALEIRSNLVLTVAVPKSVITREEDSMDVDEHSFVVAEKRKAAEKAYIEADSKKGPAQPMIISETYAKYQPERKSKSADDDEKVKQKDAIDLDMPKISLGDIVDASDDEANEDSTPAKKRAKKSKGKNKSKSRGGVKSEDVTPFDYSKATPDSTQGGDVIGKSTVTLDDSKKAKRAARNRDKKAKTKARDTFDPYAQVTTTADLAKKPNRPRVNAKSGNRSMSFKK